MGSRYGNEFLKAVWHLHPSSKLTSLSGETICICSSGEYDTTTGKFSGAEINIDGTIYYGDIITGSESACNGKTGTNNPEYTRNPNNHINTILQIVLEPSPVILKSNGEPVTQAILPIDPKQLTAYERLRDGAGEYHCARHIASMESHERIAMYTRLLADRMARKCRDIRNIYNEHDQNWNETMYVMLMRTMGDSKNKEAFTELARRVRYTAISRERNSIVYVEAMLLGASGLLEMYDDDSYIRDLKTTFNYLRQKYSIVPMEAGYWIISRTNPNNHPVLRIAQMAMFLSTREFLFDHMIKCRTVEDIHRMFRTEASQYWSTHYIPSHPSYEHPKRIGHFKASLLGINLTVPMMFAYADYTGEEKLKETALDLLEKINCEDNRFINAWRAGGVIMESAFDSQAMLQLNNEFCRKELCWQCPVCRYVLRKLTAKDPSITY